MQGGKGQTKRAKALGDERLMGPLPMEGKGSRKGQGYVARGH